MAGRLRIKGAIVTRFLANTKIMHKVLAVLLLLGAVTVGLAAWNAVTTTAVDRRYSELVNSKLPATTQMVRMNRYATEMVEVAYRTTTYPRESEQAQSAPEAIDEAHDKASKALAKAGELDPSLTARLPEIRTPLDRIHRLSADAARLGLSGDVAASARKLTAADQLLQSFGVDMVALNNGRVAQAEEEATALSDHSRGNITLSLIISLVGTVLGLAFAFWVVKKGITAPIESLETRMRRLAEGDSAAEVGGTDRQDEVGAMARALRTFRDAAIEQEQLAAAKRRADAEQQQVVEVLGQHLAAVAKGDLTAEVTADFPTEYQALKDSMNQAINSLRHLLAAVATSAAQIRTGSTEIAQASEDLARRTESNAASLEETSAAIAQMDERLKATAQAAGATVTRADQAIATVAGGRSVADEAVQAMTRVSDSAQGIDSVIEGLDKVAFQTRVLAMNAAVEAGRAGEAGRGFAVVADLVSALAMRAEEEARKARGQLTVTQSDIATAVGAVQRVDGALQDISGDVGEVHTLLASIANDNQAQAAAITQISVAVSSMDQTTQQNAAMVEETSAAARNLLGEVTTLTEQANAFQVDRRKTAPNLLTQLAAARASGVPAAAAPASFRKLPAEAVSALTRPSDDWHEF